GLEEACTAIAPLYQEWKKLSEELQAGQLSERERLQRIDLLNYQWQEIDQAKLKAGEEEELSERLPELKNAKRFRSLAETAYQTLYEAEGSALERLGQSEHAFESLQQWAPSVVPLLSELRDAKSRLEETARNLKTLAERWEADPAALEAALSRQEQLSR